MEGQIMLRCRADNSDRVIFESADDEHLALYVRSGEGSPDIFLARSDAELLRDWLIHYLE